MWHNCYNITLNTNKLSVIYPRPPSLNSTTSCIIHTGRNFVYAATDNYPTLSDPREGELQFVWIFILSEEMKYSQSYNPGVRCRLCWKISSKHLNSPPWIPQMTDYLYLSLSFSQSYFFSEVSSTRSSPSEGTVSSIEGRAIWRRGR